jgi:hypothetical protein
VEEHNGLNKTTAPKISENSQPPDFFLLDFQTNLPATVQDAQERIKSDIPDSRQIGMKDL